MSQVTFDLKTSLEKLKAQINATASEMDSSAQSMEKLEGALGKLDGATGQLVQGQKKLGDETKKRATADEKAAAAAEKEAEKEREKAEAIELMAKRAVQASDAIKLSGRAQEEVAKISVQYAEILRQTGAANSDLIKTWRAGLSPAENSARKLVEIAANTDDAVKSTLAFSVATGELTKRLDDQIRRQDTNVGSQHKLSRSLSELMDEQKKAILVSGALSGAMAKNKEAYEKSKQRLDALETAMGSLMIPGASLVYRFKEIADSLETVNEFGTPMQAKLLKVGIAVGSVTAAAGAAVVGIAALGAAIVSVAVQADEWNDELDDLGLKLDSVGTERVNRSAAAIDAVGSAAKAAGVMMADKLAGPITDAATRLTALGLAGVDAFNNLQQGEGVIERLARLAGEVLTEALFSPLTLVGKLAEGFEYLGLAPTEGVRALNATIAELKADQTDAVTSALKMMARDAVKPLIAVTDDYMGKASELITRQMEVNAAAREGKDAVDDLAIAYRGASDALKGSLEVTASEFEGLAEDIVGPTAEQLKTTFSDTMEKAAEEMEAAAERGKASWAGSANSISSSFGKLSKIAIEHSKKQGDAYEKAAIKAFRLQQASGLVGVAISTAQAIMMALGSLPPPASYVAAGAATLAGIAQAAVILNQSPPTSAGASANMPTAPSAGATQSALASKMSGDRSSGGMAPTQYVDTSVGVPKNIHVQRAEDSTIPASDGTFPASMASRVRGKGYDRIRFERNGALNQGNMDGRSLELQERQIAAIEEQTLELQMLRDAVLYTQHAAATSAPATDY